MTCSIIVSNKDTYFYSFMSKERCYLCHSFQRDGPSYLACWQDEIYVYVFFTNYKERNLVILNYYGKHLFNSFIIFKPDPVYILS